MTGRPHSKIITPGTKFGPFTFIRYTGRRGQNFYSLFKCGFCGEERERVTCQVSKGHIKTCRCQNGIAQTKHGHSTNSKGSSPTYEAWAAMKKRCLNPAHPSFSNYGGRGISVCERWMEFQDFLADMGEKPENRSLDRIDNSKGYYPENCRWATMRQQSNNKRSNTLITFNGQIHTISEWAAIIGIKDCTLSERLRKGWSVEKALSTKTMSPFGKPHAASPPAS